MQVEKSNRSRRNKNGKEVVCCFCQQVDYRLEASIQCEVLTICSPRYQTARTMSHVKGSRWIRQLYAPHYANDSRDTSFKSKLNLCFMIIPWCKRHGNNISAPEICTPAGNLSKQPDIRIHSQKSNDAGMQLPH